MILWVRCIETLEGLIITILLIMRLDLNQIIQLIIRGKDHMKHCLFLFRILIWKESIILTRDLSLILRAQILLNLMIFIRVMRRVKGRNSLIEYYKMTMTEQLVILLIWDRGKVVLLSFIDLIPGMITLVRWISMSKASQRSSLLLLIFILLILILSISKTNSRLPQLAWSTLFSRAQTAKPCFRSWVKTLCIPNLQLTKMIQ